MSAAKHTPGPWAPFILDKPLSDIPAYVGQCIAASPGDEFLFVSSQLEDGPVDVCHVGNGPRRYANARLIAAAPELLEALQASIALADKNLPKFSNGFGEPLRTADCQAIYDQCVAAVAKATGSAP